MNIFFNGAKKILEIFCALQFFFLEIFFWSPIFFLEIFSALISCLKCFLVSKIFLVFFLKNLIKKQKKFYK